MGRLIDEDVLIKKLKDEHCLVINGELVIKNHDTGECRPLLEEIPDAMVSRGE